MPACQRPKAACLIWSLRGPPLGKGPMPHVMAKRGLDIDREVWT